jgi:hypothetical protein
MASSPEDSNSSLWELQLIERLAAESFEFDSTHADPQRNCWLVVHRHIHGSLPSEYDIREIPEDLYLAVLEQRITVPSPVNKPSPNS